MDIDMKELEAFVSVVDRGSFSRAAEALYLTQPTISAHISSLENEFGAKLIIRSTKEVYPSKAGKIFYEYASEMLKMRDRAILSVKSCATDIRGSLEIADCGLSPVGLDRARRLARSRRYIEIVPEESCGGTTGADTRERSGGDLTE